MPVGEASVYGKLKCLSQVYRSQVDRSAGFKSQVEGLE